MLNAQQTTNTPPPEPPILATLPEAVAAQLVRELIRLRTRRKLTAGKDQMSYFSRSQATGRPLAVPVASFVSILMSKLHGHSVKRAAEILEADPEAASPMLWRLAAVAHSEGIRTSADFEVWAQRELSEAMTAPSIP